MEKIEKIVCLVIDKRHKEWIKRKEKFKKIELKVEDFICGNGSQKDLKYNLIDDETIDIKFWKHNPCINGLIYRKREFCAAYGHQIILKNAVKENLNNILLLEDDAIPTEKFTEIYPKLLGKLDNLKWDIIYFGYNVAKFNSDIDFLVKAGNNVFGWHGVLLNKPIIKTLSEIKLEMPFDTYCNRNIVSKGNCYCVVPRIIIEEPNKSAILDIEINRNV